MMGNMLSGSTADNYPVHLLCEKCFEAETKRGVASEIVSFDDYDSGYGISCENCSTTIKEERQGRN
jgi:hypothetical protein